MVSLNLLLKQEKSPILPKQMKYKCGCDSAAVQEETKVYSELHGQTEHGMLSWLPARPDHRQQNFQLPCVTAPGISARASATTRQMGEQ